MSSATEKQNYRPDVTSGFTQYPSLNHFPPLPLKQQRSVVFYESVPEGDVPPLEQDFSILLPHLQQHVKQLGHWETITLQEGKPEQAVSVQLRLNACKKVDEQGGQSKV